MPSRVKPPNILKILKHLRDNESEEYQPVEDGALDPQLILLRSWQTERLKETYADLLADPQHRLASLFFMNDIYGPQDYSQRDYDFERLYTFLTRFLPDPMLRMLADGIELNDLTNDLDNKLLRVLVDELGMGDELDAGLYAEGFRVCDNYDARVSQIELIVKLLDEVVEGAHFPMVGVTLRLARRPAYSAGWYELYDFLERGYAATKSLPDEQIFATTIRERERRILDQIYATAPDPFVV